MLKFGIISEVLAAKGMARVKFADDNIVSAPLHCAALSTLDDQVQFPFNVNQHVYCIMDERCERGVIAGAIYDEGNPPADGSANIVRMKFKDGLEIKYEKDAKKLTIQGQTDIEINITGDANVTCNNAKVIAQFQAEIQATTEVKLTAPITEVSGILKCASIVTTAPAGPGLHIDDSGNVTTSGNIQSTGEVQGATVVQGAIQLGTHKHSGVTTGGGTSGTPTP